MRRASAKNYPSFFPTVVAVAALAVTARNSTASADDSEKNKSRESASHPDARDFYNKGISLFYSHEYVLAYCAFKDGYDLSHRPLFLVNMGQALAAAGDHEEATGPFEQYLAATRRSPEQHMVRALLQRARIMADQADRPSEPVSCKPSKPALLAADMPMVSTVPLAGVVDRAPEPRVPAGAVSAAQEGPDLRLAKTVPVEAQDDRIASPVRKPLYRRPAFWGVIGLLIGAGVAGFVLVHANNNAPNNTIGMLGHQ